MKKQINFRPIFYCFIALGLGIYFARSIFSANIYIIFALSLALIALTVICIKYKCVKRLIILFSTFVLGVGIFALSLVTFSGNNFTNGTYTVSGRIVIVNDYSGMQNVILDNVYIDGNKSGNMSVSVTGATTMEEGYVITFTGYIEKTQLFSFNKFNNYYYKYKIVSTAKVKSAEVTMDDFKGLTLSENLRKSIKLILDKNMSSEDASISYASLFGDKTYISDEVRDSFSISGIAHLLAVSGLHIGFLTTALLFLLNRTKLKRYVNVIIISIFLVFYCYLCSFSVSVVRASIMFFVMSLANILGKQYDKLNSIGLAGIIVLLYKPLSVFDPGFLLSFGCVLGIFMFTNYFKNLFTKWNFPQKLCDTLSIMFAVQLGILPLTIYYYGQLSLLTMLANFICMPVFEIFFIFLFAIVPIVAIIPLLSFLLKFPAIIISFIIKVAQIIASQKWAIINLSFVSPFALVGIYVV
ncbi:MAG: ComEC/Rec2 family competence protein, partial [Eubacteriales bacterium]|nr:ComEC/Rec2 family competence protein [Eubacteriales bacterium]